MSEGELIEKIVSLGGGPVLVAAVVKYLFARFVKDIDEKFERMAKSMQKQNDNIHSIELKLAGYELSARTQDKIRVDLEDIKEKVILQGSQIKAAWRELDGQRKTAEK